MNALHSLPHSAVPDPVVDMSMLRLAQGFLRGNLRACLQRSVENYDACWCQFKQSWDALVQDEFMGDGGQYRFRRYAVFEANNQGEIRQGADQRHYQSAFYNGLNGGIYREYPCFEPSTLENPIFRSLLQFTVDSSIEAQANASFWHAEAHQFRIQATLTELGKPVPEGIHRDGVDYVFIFLIDRQNIRGGVSRVYHPQGNVLAELKLRIPLDFMVVDDREVFHYVTPIHARAPDSLAYRDVLVVTLRKQDQSALF